VSARAVRIWTEQDLLNDSDLAVIAAATASRDTTEQIDLPGFAGQRVVGVETRFAVSAVLKGDKKLTEVVIHHYRPAPGAAMVPNGPTFVYFAVPEGAEGLSRSYLLFLHREADGRYASVVGQADPGLGVRQLEGVYENAATEIQTKLGVEIGKVLKECRSIRPGMTRAELTNVFSTEGGLSTITHRTYVYRDCPYVKVDVDFAVSTAGQDVEKPTDVVSKISKPYLDYTISD
jgi:hypothetical protein